MDAKQTQAESWTADECTDINGNITIRPSDGTPNGDTSAEPIATVYDASIADFLVRACNANAELLEACSEYIEAFDTGIVGQQGRNGDLCRQRLAKAFRAAIAKAQ